MRMINDPATGTPSIGAHQDAAFKEGDNQITGTEAGDKSGGPARKARLPAKNARSGTATRPRSLAPSQRSLGGGFGRRRGAVIGRRSKYAMGCCPWHGLARVWASWPTHQPTPFKSQARGVALCEWRGQHRMASAIRDEMRLINPGPPPQGRTSRSSNQQTALVTGEHYY